MALLPHKDTDTLNRADTRRSNNPCTIPLSRATRNSRVIMLTTAAAVAADPAGVSALVF